MSYTPLKINAMGSLLQDVGLYINPNAQSYMGTSTSVTNYTPGTIIDTTILSAITNAMNVAYPLIGAGITQGEYNNLISIGSSTIPALGNAKPSTYINAYTGQNTRHGFLRLIAWQAHKDFYINNGSYSDFLATFNAMYGKKTQMNNTIKALNNSLTFLDGIYSNMNDLITADIAGINLSTFYWGQDLIAMGKAIDLKYISTFGNPDDLLRTLYKNGAVTQSINLGLLSAGMTSNDITNIFNGTPATSEQQKYIYATFCLIIGDDLTDVLTPLNCQTKGLVMLADLLDPKKLFPNSYQSLTTPVFNSAPLPTNSKTYYLIYKNGTIDAVPGLSIGDRLNNIIPPELAYSCDALSRSMMQVRNIQNMDIEKFSQVVSNLENVNGLGVNGTNIPTNTELANVAIDAVAKGSGTNGLYTMCDFFGSMTDIHYDWAELQAQIRGLQSTNLFAIYNNINSLLGGFGPYGSLQTLIDSANDEIYSIMIANPTLASTLNSLYNKFGEYIAKEENARLLALSTIDELTSTTSDTINFIDSLSQYATETEIKESALVIENICDTTTVGGNSIIAAMREARNAKRLGYTGAEQDNDVNIASDLVLPRVTGETLGNSPIDGFVNCSNLSNIPIITGAATVPGSLAGSSQTTLIPNNLSILIEPGCATVLTPTDAIADVVLCNCDCWENL